MKLFDKVMREQGKADTRVLLPSKQVAAVVRQIVAKGVCDKECWVSLNAALEIRGDNQ